MLRTHLMRTRTTMDTRRANARLRRELLISTARMLVRPGESPATVIREFTTIARRLARSASHNLSRPERLPAGMELDGLAEVLGQWSSDHRFADENGLPAPLRLRGAVSLTQLIRSVIPRANIKRLIGALLRSGSVRKQGTHYCAVDPFISYVEEAAYVSAYSLEAHRDLLNTIRHNVQSALPAQRFLERTVAIDNIPASKLRVLHARLKHEFGPALSRADELLRSYRVSRPSAERTTTITLRAHVAENPILTGAGAPTSKRMRQRRTARKGSGE